MTTDHRGRYGPHAPDVTYVAHAFPEQLADLGEVQMNYATAGDALRVAMFARITDRDRYASDRQQRPVQPCGPRSYCRR